MDNFTLKKLALGKYVVFSPFRGGRPSDFIDTDMTCPFDDTSGGRNQIIKVYQQKNEATKSITVLKNAFPFTHTHEVLVLSTDHDKRLDELSREQVKYIFEAYRDRFMQNLSKGQVVIFHNQGSGSGASIQHPHSQIILVPKEHGLELLQIINSDLLNSRLVFSYNSMDLLTPSVSQFPYEAWIVPKNRGRAFNQINDEEISNLSLLLLELIGVLKSKFDKNLSYNYVIYPKQDFYIRIIPRINQVGGLELATNLFVNTEKPEDVMNYLKTHLGKIL